MQVKHRDIGQDAGITEDSPHAKKLKATSWAAFNVIGCKGPSRNDVTLGLLKKADPP